MARSRTLSSYLALGAGLALAALLGLAWTPTREALLATNGYVPHGFCIGWEPGLLWLHVITDTLIGIAYVVIALFLAVLVHFARHDIPFHWVLLAFGAFIITCGSTHFMEAVTFWYPLYWLSGGAKVITAVASVATAVALPPLLPRVLDVVAAAKVSNARKQQLEAANAELAGLYQRVKDLDGARTRFFANVSHELRTPLTLIIGPTERLLDDPALAAGHREDLEVVARNARTLLAYVGDLLDIAQIEAGTHSQHRQTVDLAALVRSCAAHFETFARDRRVALDVQAPETLLAELDAAQIQRVVLNLLGNAFKFTPPGGAVRCGVRAAGDALQITVADTGPGVPPGERERIFERFQQIGDPAAARLAGTGLGLAIVRELVAGHGGTVSVDDAREGGARFVVTLPRGAPERAAAPLPRIEAAPPAADPPDPAPVQHGGPRPAAPDQARVLVVEDHPDMRRLLADTLAADYEVATAADGRDGLAQAHALRPDLILTDLMMPGMAGDELVRAVRSAPELADIPVVLLTARADVAQRVQALRAGAQDYVVKPFVAEELRARLHNLVAMKRARDRLQTLLASQQDDIAALAQEVAARSAEREAALSREQATAAENARLYAETRAALAVREEFTRVAAHELRTPVAALLGHAQLISRRAARSGGLEERDQRAVDVIASQAARLHRLAEQILTLTQIDRDALDVALEPLDLAALAAHVAADLRPSLDRHELAVAEPGAPGSWVVRGDVQRLRQALHAVIDNAVKYSPAGGAIDIRLVASAAEQGVAVTDAGIGIPAAALARLGERFYRAPNITAQQYSGMGIGLHVAQAILRAHGGRLGVESAEGRGTTVTLWLPRAGELPADEGVGNVSDDRG